MDFSIQRVAALAVALAVAACAQSPTQPQASSPGAADGPKPATAATKAANAKLLQELPFGDKTSFEAAHKGFIAPLPQNVLTGPSGNAIWDPAKYAFIKEGIAAPDTVNPSLWRQSQLINISGLFKVADGLYQVRNHDLSNMTIVEGQNGITVMDPLISAETAKSALDLYHQHRPKKPVVAVIYTHSHVDHYGGVRGVVDEADVKAGKVKIYAPAGFLEAAVAENVMAGTAMSRRASYMYGNLLPPSPTGQVGAGLGTTTSAGTVTLIPPTVEVIKTGETHVIDGLTYVFLMAPGSEAPAEFLFYIKEKKALNSAEDAAHTLHNTYSLRGAKIREPLPWSKYLNQAMSLWGSDVQVMYGMHHWPVFGNKEVNEHLAQQRDMYRFINDETLRMTNKGLTMTEIAEQFKMPKAIATNFSNRGYYGSVNHNVKATYVLYMGWFIGNPATLNELPPEEAGKRYVDMMGGADNLMKKARDYYDKGDYRFVAQVVNNLVFAEPNNQAARNLQADALEQLGYQAESGPWRNFYLTGAKELREGIKKLPTPDTASPDTVRAMDLDLFFDYLAMRLNAGKTEGKKIGIALEFTDLKKSYALEMENGVLNHTEGRTLKSPDASLSLTRDTLNKLMLKETTLQAAVSSGAIKVQGNEGKLEELMSYMDTFEFWFPIVTP